LELARSLGVSDRVHLLGSRSEAQKAACLHVCELLAMPSRDIPSEPPEGFGIVYLEANLCGKPVIAARTGGVADAVEDGVNGLLVEPDRPDQVAEAAARLLSNPAEAAALGERGRRRACERFSWTAIAPQFRRAVTELTGA
jgi:glycosyltransferase involved in cell wall biosynthesis